jgi:hypothetical protein
MERSEDSESLYLKLRTLAYSEPKKARYLFCKLLDAKSPLLESLFDKCSELGESRTRHVVANAFKNRDDREIYSNILFAWLDVEDDEFTKTALLEVVAGIEPKVDGRQSPSHNFEKQLIEPYRYISERLCHRVRNSIPEVRTEVLKLRASIVNITDSTIKDEIVLITNKLDDAVVRVGEVVGFDSGDGKFNWRNINLYDWLLNYANEWNTQNKLVNYNPSGDSGTIIFSTEFHLETIFWNIWTNTIQEIGTGCNISISFQTISRSLQLTILDNGAGFDGESKENIFEGAYSNKGSNRGKGMLEVEDAVNRLKGDAKIIMHTGTEYRLMISFPVAEK